MLKHIKVIPFIIGIIIGMCGIMFVDPDKNVVYKYPNPEGGDDKTIYKDKNGVCYKYSAKEVDCDKNEGKLKSFPLSK
jgi:hypothetical protein